MTPKVLHHQPLDPILQRPDLSRQITALIRRDTRCNDSSRDTCCAAQCYFAGYVDITDIFVFAEKGKMEEDGEGRGVCSEDEEFGRSAVEL